MVAAQTPKEVIYHLDRYCDSYSRLPYFLQNYWHLDDADWLKVLGDIWTGCDNIGQFLDELLDSPLGMRIGSGPIVEMMTEDELSEYLALPDLITVYRGCYQNNKWGICWSLEKAVAAKFPILNRYQQQGTPLLVKAIASKSNIVAFKMDRDEREVITWYPKHISTSHIRIVKT